VGFFPDPGRPRELRVEAWYAVVPGLGATVVSEVHLKEAEKYLIVVNPVGRGGHAMRQGVWLLSRLRKMGIEHEALFTEKAGHAQELVANWADDVDVVVAVGGDGTVNEVINGIMNSRQEGRTLAVFPSGTADDFARNMKIPRDRDGALKVMVGEYEKSIDLMKVNDRYAGVTVGIGLDAEIAYRSYKSKHLRLMAYWYHGLSMLFKPLPKSSLAVTVGYESDGFEGDYLLVVAGNAGSYGRYMKMMPEASVDDGLLDMAIFHTMNRFKALLLFGMSIAGKHGWAREMRQYKSPRFHIECLADVYAQFDGEVSVFPAGQKMEMAAERAVLKVRVPRRVVGR
jgi:diacylglycerol kinase (ATP)